MAILFAAYGQAGDSNRMIVYDEMLKDVPIGLLDKACRKVIAESKFLPSVAEILAAARSLIGTQQPAERVKPFGEAWEEIERAMFSTPWGRYPDFSTAEITITVKRFGWHDLRTVTSEDVKIVRAQIRKIYEEVCSQGRNESTNQSILGVKPEGILLEIRQEIPKPLDTPKEKIKIAGPEEAGRICKSILDALQQQKDAESVR